MFVKQRTFQVMSGEPHLGSVVEPELIAKEYEIEDYILDNAMEYGLVSDEYEIDGYIIYAEEYVDVEMVNDYLANTPEEEVTESKLYAAAFVTAPKDRDERK